MPSQVKSIMGQMWDHFSLAAYESEMGMRDVAEANLENMDALVLSGNLKINLPPQEESSVQPTRMLPP